MILLLVFILLLLLLLRLLQYCSFCCCHYYHDFTVLAMTITTAADALTTFLLCNNWHKIDQISYCSVYALFLIGLKHFCMFLKTLDWFLDHRIPPPGVFCCFLISTSGCKKTLPCVSVIPTEFLVS